MRTLNRSGQSTVTRRRRRAAAVVEFAVISPVLLTILFGIIEYGYVFMVRQTLTHAAREACRVAVLQTTDEPYTEVTQRVDQVMNAAGLSGHTTTMVHAETDNNWTESITVSIPRQEISLLGNYFGELIGDVSGTCSMRKEGVSASEE